MTNLSIGLPVDPAYAGTQTPPGAAFVGAFLSLGVLILIAAGRLLPRRGELHPRYGAPRR